MVDCPQCGQFTISRSAVANLRNEDDSKRWKISAWINEFAPTMVTSTDIDLALASMVPSLHRRVDRMLRWIAAAFSPGIQFSISDLGGGSFWEHSPNRPVDSSGESHPSSLLIPVGWNKTFEEMWFMVTEVLCNEMGLLVSQNNHEYQVSPKGLLYLEGRRESVSSVGFCAMWFSPDVLPLWTDVIEPATRAAGYEPVRIDSKPHNGKIDDEIMASIRASRFVVSDFTGNRGGVYYEAGFAHGLGLPVIFMCREDALKDMHFDIRQYNCILWTPEKLEDAKAQLRNRILATLGQGPKLVQ
ncbi:MAG: hypothetical protein Q7S97_01990 [Polaromonas sp.]|nr:hypothetical protein [Polaromonas sp.]